MYLGFRDISVGFGLFRDFSRATEPASIRSANQIDPQAAEPSSVIAHMACDGTAMRCVARKARVETRLFYSTVQYVCDPHSAGEVRGQPSPAQARACNPANTLFFLSA